MVKTLFNPNVSQINNPKITGQDLVSETNAEEVDSAILGSEKRKQKGLTSLLIQPTEKIYKKEV